MENVQVNTIVDYAKIGYCDVVTSIFKVSQYSPKILSSGIVIGIDPSNGKEKRKLLVIKDIPFKIAIHLSNIKDTDSDGNKDSDPLFTDDEVCEINFTAEEFRRYMENSFKGTVKNTPQYFDPLVCEYCGVFQKNGSSYNYKNSFNEQAKVFSDCKIDINSNIAYLETFNYYAFIHVVRKHNKPMTSKKLTNLHMSVIHDFDQKFEQYNVYEVDINMVAIALEGNQQISTPIGYARSLIDNIVKELLKVDDKGFYKIDFYCENNFIKHTDLRKRLAIDFTYWPGNGIIIPYELKKWISKHFNIAPVSISAVLDGQSTTEIQDDSYITKQRILVNEATLEKTFCRNINHYSFCTKILHNFVDVVIEKAGIQPFIPQTTPPKWEILDISNLSESGVETVHFDYVNFKLTKRIKNKLNKEEFLSSYSSSAKKFKKVELQTRIMHLKQDIRAKKNQINRLNEDGQDCILLLDLIDEQESMYMKLSNLEDELKELELKSTSKKVETERDYTHIELSMESERQEVERLMKKRKLVDVENIGEDEFGNKKMKSNDDDNSSDVRLSRNNSNDIRVGNKKKLNYKITDFFNKN
jgi:hypothetical protein